MQKVAAHCCLVKGCLVKGNRRTRGWEASPEGQMQGKPLKGHLNCNQAIPLLTCES